MTKAELVEKIHAKAGLPTKAKAEEALDAVVAVHKSITNRCFRLFILYLVLILRSAFHKLRFFKDHISCISLGSILLCIAAIRTAAPGQ